MIYKGYECDCSSGDCNMDLPTTNPDEGTIIGFKKMDASGNSIKISAKVAGQTIDGSTNIYITSRYDNVFIRFNGSNYSIV